MGIRRARLSSHFASQQGGLEPTGSRIEATLGLPAGLRPCACPGLGPGERAGPRDREAAAQMGGCLATACDHSILRHEAPCNEVNGNVRVKGNALENGANRKRAAGA